HRVYFEPAVTAAVQVCLNRPAEFLASTVVEVIRELLQNLVTIHFPHSAVWPGQSAGAGLPRRDPPPRGFAAGTAQPATRLDAGTFRIGLHEIDGWETTPRAPTDHQETSGHARAVGDPIPGGIPRIGEGLAGLESAEPGSGTRRMIDREFSAGVRRGATPPTSARAPPGRSGPWR